MDDISLEEFARIASEATAKAAEETMKIMGYNVIVLNGWVVKIFPDGTTKKISEIPKSNTPLRLD